MVRTAYDFDPHAFNNLRRYMKSFAPPEPERADAVEILLQISKRDEGALSIRPHPLRVLEVIKPLTILIDNLVTDCKWSTPYN